MASTYNQGILYPSNFDKFTLYPGGAVMACESAYEYDEHLNEARVVDADEADEMEERIRSRLAKRHESEDEEEDEEDESEDDEYEDDEEEVRESIEVYYDPVERVVSKISDLNHRLLKPIRDHHITDDSSNNIQILEKIREDTSTLYYRLREILLKAIAVEQAAHSDHHDEFDSYRGVFLKNASRIKREGLDKYSYSCKVIRYFLYDYDINQFVYAISNSPELIKDIISFSEMQEMCGTIEPLNQYFSTTADVIDKLFDDDDEFRTKIEMDDTTTLDFSYLMHHYVTPEPDVATGPLPHVGMFNMMSVSLRMLSMSLYQMECHILDDHEGEESEEAVRHHRRKLNHIQNAITNIFAIVSIMALYHAYQTRRHIAEREALHVYVAQLLDFIKPEE